MVSVKATKAFQLLLSMVFAVFLGITLSSDACACDPLNCNPTIWNWKTRVVFLPDYPNCPIEVGYRERICNGIIIEVRVHSYSFLPSSDPDCQQFDNDQQNPDGSPDWTQIGRNFRDLYSQLVADLFEEFYTGLTDPDLKELYDCDGGATKQYSGVWGSCVEYEICFTFPGPWTVEISECSDLLCCLQETTICWDPNTNEPVVVETYTPVNEDCGDPELVLELPCIRYGCVPFCEDEVGKGSSFRSPIDGQFGTIHNLVVAPNPFETETSISYQLSEQTEVKIVLLDNFGREVITVFEGRQSKGLHRVNLQSDNLLNGMYTLQVRTRSVTATGSVILLK